MKIIFNQVELKLGVDTFIIGEILFKKEVQRILVLYNLFYFNVNTEYSLICVDVFNLYFSDCHLFWRSVITQFLILPANFMFCSQSVELQR